jgi:hypothetical protein
MMARGCEVEMNEGRLEAVSLGDELVEADVFVEATGSAGPQRNCRRYGNGCVMCILRCPTWGGRVSIAERAGINEMVSQRPDGARGAMSGSCKLHKDSVDPAIVADLNRDGVAVVPIPKQLVQPEKLAIKACQQYALAAYAENLILLDTGHVKLMTSYFPLEELRSIPGMQNARYEDPYAGGRGNSVRYLALSPRDNCLKVQGVDNLFCAGEKVGLMVGHTEAIVSGTLAGHNAARWAAGKPLLELPNTTAAGDIISFVGEQMQTEAGRTRKYTFSGSVYFERMKERGLYSLDRAAIAARVAQTGLAGVFAGPVH